MHRRRAADAGADGGDTTASEKTTATTTTGRTTRTGVEVLAAVLRVGQFATALFAYLSFAGLYSYISHYRLGETSRMVGVRQMALFSVIYATLVLVCFHVFARLRSAGCSSAWTIFVLTTVPGDLLMMGVAIAQITILGMAGLPADCHGLTRETYFEGDLARQPRDGFTTIRFGPGTQNNHGELDFLCHLPRIVYSLSVVAIFSYSLSMLLSIFQVQRDPRKSDPEEGSQQSYVTETAAVPEVAAERQRQTPSFLPSSTTTRCTQPMQQAARPQSPQMNQVSRTSTPPSFFSPQQQQQQQQPPPQPPSFLPPLRPPTAPFPTAPPAMQVIAPLPDGSEEPKYANMPPDVTPRGRRLSMETTTSSVVDPDVYLVTDGFRPSGDPPAYTSRPSSLYDQS